MSYKFKVSETFPEGLQRIAGEQIRRTGGSLQAVEDIHKGVHEARKTFKRLRALLSLYRDALDETFYRELDHRFRDIGRSLAKTREIQALLDSLALLDQRFESGGRKGVVTNLRLELERQRSEAEAELGLAPEALTASYRDLTEVAEQIASIRIGADAFEAIEGGLRRTYRGARSWHGRAYTRESGGDADSETFHEWRKHLQRHWRHMQLLTQAWPGYIRPRAQLTHRISEIIGQEHDLSVLDARLAASGRSLGSAPQVRTCRAKCRQLQLELRASVRTDGQLLFLESPKAFTKRLQRYWAAAAETNEVAETSDLVSEPT